MNHFLYLPTRNRIESAIPLTQVLRVDYEHNRDPAKVNYSVTLVGGKLIELGYSPPFTKQLIEPVGWERWEVEAIGDDDDDGQTEVWWTNAPVLSVVRCSAEPSGEIWYEEPAAMCHTDHHREGLFVDVARQACRAHLDDQWSGDLVHACELILDRLKQRHPEIRQLDLPSWITKPTKTAELAQDQAGLRQSKRK